MATILFSFLFVHFSLSFLLPPILWLVDHFRFPFFIPFCHPLLTRVVHTYFSPSGEILFEEKRCARAFSLGLRSINNSAKIIWSPRLVQSLGLFLSIQSWLSPAGVNKHGRGVELSLMMVEEGTWLLCSKFLSVYFFSLKN